MRRQRTFLEFFAGGGMARSGLGDSWRCLLANDFAPDKCSAYRMNFGGDDLVEGDIAALDDARLPRARADLAWASFPCQDLSLAGGRSGLSGARSGTFFAFWRLMETLAARGAGPRVIALENVAGLLTSNNGRDFAAVANAIAQAGYAVTAMVLDARHFTPQSRPRLFILGFAPDLAPARGAPSPKLHPRALHAALDALSHPAQARWFWPATPPLPRPNATLADVLEHDAPKGAWRSAAQTRALLELMHPRHRAQVAALRKGGAPAVGAVYKRIRVENGVRVQRAEPRFDGLAGCLRTPAGGSSRQTLLFIEGARVRSRLLTAREAARLMGLPDEYRLPASATAALKLCGDGVCVPAVRWLAETVIEPALASAPAAKRRGSAAA